MAFSRDGRHFVYNELGGLYLRTMGELRAQLIPGTEGGLTNPFFSPDGESLAFGQDDELKRIRISGGAPMVICSVGPLFGASWGPDNTVLFGQREGVMRVSANGGTPELVIKANESEQVDGPQLLPDRDSVLFSVTTGKGLTRWDQAQIVVQSLRTGERKIVLQGGSDARYVPGHLIYALGDTLFAVTFDAERLEAEESTAGLTGVARPAGVLILVTWPFARCEVGRSARQPDTHAPRAPGVDERLSALWFDIDAPASSFRAALRTTRTLAHSKYRIAGRESPLGNPKWVIHSLRRDQVGTTSNQDACATAGRHGHFRVIQTYSPRLMSWTSKEGA